MAAIYKVEMYVTDYNEDYSVEDLKNELDRYINAGIHYASVEESHSFEWQDNLQINKTNAKTTDFEQYFK